MSISIFQLVQIVEGVWLSTQIMERKLQLHPGLVLVAIINTLISVSAMIALMITPLIGSLEIVLRYVIRRKRAGLAPWSKEESLQWVDDDTLPDIPVITEMFFYTKTT